MGRPEKGRSGAQGCRRYASDSGSKLCSLSLPGVLQLMLEDMFLKLQSQAALIASLTEKVRPGAKPAYKETERPKAH